jgi:predicted ATPase
LDHLVIISGCSGGGKSTLLQEMAHRGYGVVEEPGRRIIAEEREGQGRALPWVNLAAFAERAVELSLEDRARAKDLQGPVFFDRGLIDAAAALEFATGKPVLQKFAAERFNRRVFMTPPWPEIYVMDADRRHGLEEATNEYERLLSAYSALNYDVRLLPKVPVAERADLIAGALGLT